MSKSDWGRRTGRTADNKRKEYFNSLTKEKQEESALYVSEGRLVGTNTPETVPAEFKILLKFKFYCPHCKDYHSHSAGKSFCESNPNRQAAIDNAKKKAAHHYYNKGRKHEIAHGNNINKERLSEMHKKEIASRTPEQLAALRKAVSASRKGVKLTEQHKKILVDSKKQSALQPKYMEKSLEKEGVIAPAFNSHNFSPVFVPKVDREGFYVEEDDYRSSDDSFGRIFDDDGDFNPFG